MDILNKILEKLFSGKFALLVMVGLTYCMSIYLLFWLVQTGKMESKEFVGVLGGLSTLLGMLWKDYVHTSVTSQGGSNGQISDSGAGNGGNLSNGEAGKS